MPREYDFGDGGKVTMTTRSNEHSDMFAALQSLGPMGAKIARYINELKAQISQKQIAESRAGQSSVHQAEFPKARPGNVPKQPAEFVFSDGGCILDVAVASGSRLPLCHVRTPGPSPICKSQSIVTGRVPIESPSCVPTSGFLLPWSRRGQDAFFCT